MTKLDPSSNYSPKKIGEFNIPKTVIENKIDSLAILELMLRKDIATWEEVDEIREAVVMHLNVIFPELQLTYSTPQPLKEEAPIANKEEGPKKPLYYSAPPPGAAPTNSPVNESKGAVPPVNSVYGSTTIPPKIKPSLPKTGKPPLGMKPKKVGAEEVKGEAKPKPKLPPRNTNKPPRRPI